MTGQSFARSNLYVKEHFNLMGRSLICVTVIAGRAVECAQVFAEASLHPVKIVRGGFQRFTALYTFLRTEKILYTITVKKNKADLSPKYILYIVKGVKSMLMRV